MSSPRLPNYLRKYRKRLGLTQKEVAFLLGTESGTKISRYECFSRDPGFETALAYEAIFDEPVSKLFPGIYEKIEAEMRERAKMLLAHLDRGKPGTAAYRKYQILAAIAGIDINQQ